MQRFILMFLSVGLLFGCSMVPDEITVAEGTQLVSYQAALEQSEQAVGQKARWGGVIADVRNTNDGTIIEVVNYNLRSYGRPVVGDSSDGRFRAKIDGFIDPMVYKEGRSVTFTGVVGTPEPGQIDEYRYLFPTLQVEGRYLWKEQQQTSIEVDYSTLWYRHHYFAQPYRYYPVPVRVQGDKKDNKSDN